MKKRTKLYYTLTPEPELRARHVEALAEIDRLKAVKASALTTEELLDELSHAETQAYLALDPHPPGKPDYAMALEEVERFGRITHELRTRIKDMEAFVRDVVADIDSGSGELEPNAKRLLERGIELLGEE